MLYQAMPMERENDQVWISPSKQGMPKQFTSPTMSRRYLWKNCSCIISGLSTQRRRIDKEMIKEHNTEQVSIMFPKKTFQPLIKSLKKKQKNTTNR
mgnify:CR=1 FL=1